MGTELAVTDQKSFWKRPEGKTGALILVGVAGAMVYGWAKIVPFLVSMMADTFELALLTAGIVVFGILVSSSKTHILFRLLSRALTGLFIEINPIGILKDRVSQMRKRRGEMDQQVNNVSQQLRTLKDVIAKNVSEVAKEQREAITARSRGASSNDREEQLRMTVAGGVRENQVARLMRSNATYEQLRVTLQNVYDVLIRLEVYLDGYILDTENATRTEEIKHKTVSAAVGAWRSAMRIISGNANEKELYDQTLEFLADDASQKLGEIDDYQRRVTNFMDNIDLENASVSTDALKALDTFQPKFLPPSTSKTVYPAGKAVVELKAVSREDSSYMNPFNRK